MVNSLLRHGSMLYHIILRSSLFDTLPSAQAGTLEEDLDELFKE